MNFKKTLITFVHYDCGNKQKVYRENLNFFQKVGVIENENYHFNFVVNSETGIENIIPRKNVFAIQGHNKGHDFGAYKQSLESVDINDYDYFIFINDTCRGPFIPDYIPSEITWVEMFLDKLDETVKMVGATWWTNTNGDAWTKKHFIKNAKHIQSYCFGVDKVGIEILQKHNKFNTIGKSRDEIIIEHEIGSSQILIENGYEIRSFQLSRRVETSHCSINKLNLYFGNTIDALEVMFIKDNAINGIVKNYTKWILSKK
jgi:lipopolysaccharide biosynthesis protein